MRSRFVSPHSFLERALSRVLLISLLFSLLSAQTVTAQPSRENSVKSIFKVSSELSGACASALLITPRSILVAAHFSNAACKKGLCTGIELLDSRGERVFFGSAKLERRSELLDTAVLELERDLDPSWQSLKLPNANSEPKTDLWLAGFPRCENFSQFRASLKSFDGIEAIVSSIAAAGSSGSALLNSSGELVGTLRASTALDGIRGETTELRISSGASFNAFIMDEGYFSQASQDLIDLYLEQQTKKESLERLLSAGYFFDLVSRFERDLEEGMSLQFLTPAGSSFPSEVAEEDGLRAQLNILRALYARERFGDSDASTSVLSKLPLSPYKGMLNQAITYSLMALASLLLLSALWGASLLDTLQRSEAKSCIGKLFSCLIVAIAFWPLSYLIFRSLKRKA